MIVLLDENLPYRLQTHFIGHQVYSVSQMGWSGKRNGELIALLMQHGFDVLVTFDKRIPYQQNFLKYPIVVLILYAQDNTYRTLMGLMPKVLRTLSRPQQAGAIIIE